MEAVTAVTRAVRAWKTVREMLHDRGATDLASARLATDEDVAALADESTTFAVPVGRVAVVFHTLTSVVKKADLFGAVGDDADHVLLVLAAKPQGTTVRSLEAEARARSKGLEVFSVTELQYNPSHHRYVPKHERLSEADADALLKTYRLKSRASLPHILETDTMARYLGLRAGDIAKITRASPNSGETVAYRVCVAAP